MKDGSSLEGFNSCHGRWGQASCYYIMQCTRCGAEASLRRPTFLREVVGSKRKFCSIEALASGFERIQANSLEEADKGTHAYKKVRCIRREEDVMQPREMG